PLSAGRPGILHGNRTYLMQDADGQIIETHSVSAGLDYPGVGPEHSWLKDIKRADYVSVTDTEALAAFRQLTQIEGIMPALESSHALAYVNKLAPTMRPDQTIIVNLSGRGDKDIHTIAASTASRSDSGSIRKTKSRGNLVSRIAQVLSQLAAKKRKAVVPYIVAGDPEKALTVPMLHALVR